MADKPQPQAPETHPCECAKWSARPASDKPGTPLKMECDGQTRGKFAPGHDARLKSMFVKANVAGMVLVRSGEDGEDEMDVATALRSHFPNWASRVQKSTTSAQADTSRRERRAAERKPKTPRATPVEPVTCECGQPAVPGKDTCRVCSLMVAMQRLTNNPGALVDVEPLPLPEDTPHLVNRGKVVEVRYEPVPAEEIATHTVGQDNVYWYHMCEGECGHRLASAKRRLVVTANKAEYVEVRFTAPRRRMCGTCEPGWSA